MIKVTFNREKTKYLGTQRWNVSFKNISLKNASYNNISNASVHRLFKIAMEYGYHFQLV